jgi:hypothetical protein
MGVRRVDVRAFRRMGVTSYSKSAGEEWMRLMGPTRDGSRDIRPIDRIAPLRSNARTVPRPYAHTPKRAYVSSASWHDWRYKGNHSASDKQSCSP